MQNWLPIISSVGLVIGGLLFLGWAIITGFKKRAEIVNKRLDKAQVDLIAVMELEAEAWRKRYEGEHMEYVNYRQKVHDLNQISNAKTLQLVADNAELKVKTDMSPLYERLGKLIERSDSILSLLSKK